MTLNIPMYLVLGSAATILSNIHLENAINIMRIHHTVVHLSNYQKDSTENMSSMSIFQEILGVEGTRYLVNL